MIEWIAGLSATLKLMLALLGIVGAMRAKWPIGAALLLGAALLGGLFPTSWGEFASAVAAGTATDETLFLMIVVVSILVYSDALNESGQLRRVIDAFRAMVGESRLTLVTFPALIGMLPMPGGAMFSAPIVREAAQKANVDPNRLTLINYWFRHIWEYWFPVYPGVILALTLTGEPTGQFILLALPMTFFAVAAGYFVTLRGLRLSDKRQREFSPSNIRRFSIELIPLVVVVGAVALLDPMAGRLAKAHGIENMLLRRAPVLIGLAAGMVWLFLYRGLRWGALGRLLLKRNVLEMAFLALGVMVFKAVLERSGAVEALRLEFENWRVPLAVVVAGMPFIAGMVAGITVGFVGASFPLVVELMQRVPQAERAAYYFLAFTVGYAGMMFSPVHICLIITIDYFGARFRKIYGRLTALCAISIACSVALFLAYRWWQ